jgi:hypothetical protein
MRTKLLPALVAAVVLGWLPSVPGAPKPKDPEANTNALAKAVVEEFNKGLMAMDVDAVMATTEAPFYMGARKEVVDRDRLKELLLEAFRDKDFSKSKLTLEDAVTTYGDVASKLRKEVKETLDQFADRADRIVVFKDAATERGPRSLTLVRVRDGKAKIIGVFSY